MKAFSELLAFQEGVYLTSISDLGDQKLRARLCLRGHKQLPREIIGKKVEQLLAEPIEHTYAQYIDLVWAPYLQFSVTDESVAPVRQGEEYVGRFIRLYSKSGMLSRLAEISNGLHERFGAVMHFSLACQNHFVDVLAYGEPEVVDLGSRPIAFGNPLRPG
jgi:hypothetical protein